MTRKRSGWFFAVALAGALLVGVPGLALAEEEDTGYRLAADGTIIIDTIEIHGSLRQMVTVTFPREPLGIRLLELRKSFLDEILHSVDGEPF